MEYLNIIDFCSSSTSIWLRITFVIMFLYCSVRLSKFIWGLRFKIVHQTTNSSKTRRRPNRKKNRARKKHIPDVSVGPDSHSQPKEDLNTEDDLCVEPLVKFPLQSLADATKEFDLDLRISVDGLGSVFKGKLKNTEEVQPYFKDKQKLAEMVDSRLGGNFKEEELYEVCNIAEMCLKKQPSDRPPMADLVTRMSHLVE